MTQVMGLLVIMCITMLISMSNAAYYGTAFIGIADTGLFDDVVQTEPCNLDDVLFFSGVTSGGVRHFYANVFDKETIAPCLSALDSKGFTTKIFTDDATVAASCWNETNNTFIEGAGPLCPQVPGQSCVDNETYCFNNLPCTEGRCEFASIPADTNKMLKLQMVLEYDDPEAMMNWFEFQTSSPESHEVFKACAIDYSLTDTEYMGYYVDPPPPIQFTVASNVSTQTTEKITQSVLMGILSDVDACLAAYKTATKNVIDAYNNDDTINPKLNVEILFTTIPFDPKCWDGKHAEISGCLDYSVFEKCDVEPTDVECLCRVPTAEECPTRCTTDSTLEGCPCFDATAEGCPTRCTTDSTLESCPDYDPCTADPTIEGCNDNDREEEEEPSNALLHFTALISSFLVVVSMVIM